MLYRIPEKLKFIEYFDNYVIESNISNNQKCRMMGDFSINLLHASKMLLDKKNIMTPTARFHP